MAGAPAELACCRVRIFLERAEEEAADYVKWFIEHIFVLVPAQTIVGQFLATFQEFPPRRKPGSLSVDQAME
jgi:hypothetical protein